VNQGPLLKTSTPGMTRKPHGYLVLAALCLQTDITFLCNWGKVTVMLLEILGATVQILIRPGDQVPGIRVPLVQTVCQLKSSYHSVQFAAVTFRLV